MRTLPFIGGLAVLALVWSGSAGHFAPPFTAHMMMHMLVVAVAAPLLALAVVGTGYDFSPRVPLLFAPLPASLLEFAAVWGWHAPALHEFARGSVAGVALEQASFLAVGFVLWLACIGERGGGRAAGVFGLLFTSMHMTLLGALLALAPRALYGHAHQSAAGALSAIDDQNLGGVVMLAAGGAAYLLGGLILTARLLNAPHPYPRNGESCRSS
ncbi:MAG: cytochrome c oxidase assembly protein [Xanthobacteraceae bacterium]